MRRAVPSHLARTVACRGIAVVSGLRWCHSTPRGTTVEAATTHQQHPVRAAAAGSAAAAAAAAAVAAPDGADGGAATQYTARDAVIDLADPFVTDAALTGVAYGVESAVHAVRGTAGDGAANAAAATAADAAGNGVVDAASDGVVEAAGGVVSDAVGAVVSGLGDIF